MLQGEAAGTGHLAILIARVRDDGPCNELDSWTSQHARRSCLVFCIAGRLFLQCRTTCSSTRTVLDCFSVGETCLAGFEWMATPRHLCPQAGIEDRGT